MIKRKKMNLLKNKNLFVVFILLAVFLVGVLFLFVFQKNNSEFTGEVTLKEAVNKFIDSTIFKSESQTDLTNKIDGTKTEESGIVRVADANEELFEPERILLEEDMDFISNEKKFAYTIKHIFHENGSVETIYPELSPEAPRRDRPRIGDPIDDRNRDYFDVNIIVDEHDEWVRNKEVYVILYYDDFLKERISYDFEENYRINIPENFLVNGINDNFDVIIYLSNFGSNEDGRFAKDIVMVKPLPEGNSRITFNLSEAEIIRTNVDELNEQKNTNIIFYDRGIAKGDNGLSGISISLFGFREVPRNFIFRGYIADNTINEDWNFLVAYYLAPVSYQANREINHLALTKKNIAYPFERIYEFNEENLRNLTFNIKDSFYAGDGVCFSFAFFITARIEPSGRWIECVGPDRIPRETLPREVNLFFSENNYYEWAVIMNHKDNITEINDWEYNYAYNTLYQFINFEKYYNEHRNISILNAIEKPNSLKLYYNSQDEFYPYLMGYLSNGLDINNRISSSTFLTIPSDSIHTTHINSGYVRITAPDRNTYYSSDGGNFLIQCSGGVVGRFGGRINLYFGNDFEGMECVEGNYTIRWAFTNIIKDRNLYLDAVVHYDGESWTIIRQNSRVDDLGWPRRLLRRLRND